MTPAAIDLPALLRRLASRDETRTEATVQSDVRTLLLAAPLALREADLDDREIVLEQQAGGGRRIDVEAGRCVFEVKRDLRAASVRREAVEQLAGYVAARTESMEQRYVGVLTDGAEWELHHLRGGVLERMSEFRIDPGQPDVEGLAAWLGSILATSQEVTPTPSQIEMRLGAFSPAHQLDFADLADLYARNRDRPTVKLKRELWARLLTTAYGTGFRDADDLFVDHTLLVATAEVIAHCVIGLDPAAPGVSATAVATGALFAERQVHGVVEADFFDWIVEVEGGESFVRTLARRVARFAWREVEHDVLKVLYESVISAKQRKQLGEYYTPDWLADRVVDAAVAHSLTQRVLDPACGSGTFLFHAIRRYLAAADAAGARNADAIRGATEHVLGVDIHPVAVTFARVTYLLAIGPARLQSPDRPELSVPVYLGDSIQWGQERTLFTADALVIPTGGSQLWARDLRFPKDVVSDASRFDRLVADLTDVATTNGGGSDASEAARNLLRRYGVSPKDEAVLLETFRTLRELHESGHDHIWGYYVRNLARPVWLTREENRVDVVLGNPPWLSYRFMTREMQAEFRRLSQERDLWAGASVATHQDLSAIFVLRSVERYLRHGGRFAFVMPWSVLRGRHFAGFRRGSYPLPGEDEALTLAFDTAWDLHAVKPSFFPVPASVVSGTRAAEARPLRPEVDRWSGDLKRPNVGWDVAARRVRREPAEVPEARKPRKDELSDYHRRFAQGATLVPRVLCIVNELPPGPLGTGVGRIEVESRRTRGEKKPWKDVPSLRAVIDRHFTFRVHLGETILPYRVLPPLRAVLPWDGRKLLHGAHPELIRYPAFAKWWKRAEALWNEHRSSDRLTLLEQFDYRKKLEDQFPPAPHRVVYNKSGMYLAAAVVRDNAILDHSLYWGVTIQDPEARFLAAILNSEAMTARLRPLQSRGEHNPRDYHKLVWQVLVPAWDADDPRHQRLASLSAEAERIAAAVPLPEGKRFETLRRLVREAVTSSSAGKAIEVEVSGLLDAQRRPPAVPPGR